MRKLFEIGGFVATTVLIVFGVVAIIMASTAAARFTAASPWSRSSAPPT